MFVYEGAPQGARITNKHIAIDCDRSGVLFDRKTGKFLQRLRDELAFASAHELTCQMQKDVAAARQFFEQHGQVS